MNNEPVAWMFKYNKIVDNNKPEKGDEHNWIPLYTTPQIKELSDEEIIEFIKSWEGLVVTNRTMEMFRAILRKRVRNERIRISR